MVKEQYQKFVSSVNNRNFMVLTTASYSVPWECYGGFAKEEGGASAAYVSY
jgi:hypothetical protein